MTTINQPTGILFDYNGVIVDDEPLHELAFKEVLAGFGAQLTSQQYNTYCQGRTDSDGFLELKAQFPTELSSSPLEELVVKKQEAYQRLLPNHDILYPGVISILKD